MEKETRYIDLYTPSGIGDIYWILQKLARTANEQGCKFRIHTPPFDAPQASRSKFLEHLDCVESSAPDGIPYVELVAKAKQYEQLESVMYCECNTWLEAGNRVELYMPAFPTEFVLNWQIDYEAIREAQGYINPDRKNIVVYTSSRKNNESASTGPWEASDWKPRIEKLRAQKDENGNPYNLIWIGAGYDKDILPDFGGCFDSVLIDRPADVVLSLLRVCDGFISYQSGLSCITVAEKIPTYMLYFRKIELLSTAINPPDGEYERAFFDEMPDFNAWAAKIEKRAVSIRTIQKDYTYWVNNNIDQTEKDWLKNPWIHEDQYSSIKHLTGPILEVGCGSGQLATYVKTPYTGIDQSGLLLDLARKKNPGKTFILADVRDLRIEPHENVCAFGFLKHFSLAEHDEVFTALAKKATKTLTIEIPIKAAEFEDKWHDFPHVFVTTARVEKNAKANGFEIVNQVENRSGEMIFHMVRSKA